MKATFLFSALFQLSAGGLLLLASGCSPAGTVVSVQDDQLTLARADGSQQTLFVGDFTQITRDGQPIELEQLESGDAVNVVVEDRDGLETAKSITALSKQDQTAPESATDPTEPDASVVPPANPEEPTPLPSLLNETVLPFDGRGDERGPLHNSSLDQATFQGEIMELSPGELTLMDIEGAGHLFKTSQQTIVTVDGVDADLGDLEVGYSADVAVQQDGASLTAKAIHAMTQH